MRRGRLFLYLAFIIILVVVLVGGIYLRFIAPSRQAAVQATPTPAPVKVVVFSQNLPQGYILDNTVLTAISWPSDKIVPGMFVESSLNELIGRQIKYAVEAGMPVLGGILLNEGEQIPQEGSPWAYTIPPGMVAVSIPINRLSGVSYAPRPGDHVDVIGTSLIVDVDTEFQSVLPNTVGLVIAAGPPNPVTGKNDVLTVEVVGNVQGRVEIDPTLNQAIYVIPSEPQRPRMVSYMLIQDAIVLQIGDFPLKGQAAEAEAGQPTPTPQPQQASVLPQVITLIVRPEDAVALNFLMHTNTQLSLTLRAANDSSRFVITPVTLQFLFEQYQIPLPLRLPYSLNPRIDQLAPLSEVPQAPQP